MNVQKLRTFKKNLRKMWDQMDGDALQHTNMMILLMKIAQFVTAIQIFVIILKVSIPRKIRFGFVL